MDDLAGLIPFLVKEDNTFLWKTLLNSFKELRIFIKKPKDYIPLINSLLNEHDSRTQGLKLLQLFLRQAPRSILNEHSLNWFNSCFKGLIQPSISEQHSYSFLVLSDLLEISTEFPDVRKQVSQVFIPKILDSIINRLSESSQSSVSIFKCLFVCLLNYGKSCGNHKGKLEELLVRLLTSEWSIPDHFIKCFPLLAQCGPPGAELINYRQGWETQHLIVINSMQSTLDQLYCDVDEIVGLCEVTTTEKKKWDITSNANESPLHKYHNLSRIFSSLCLILERMLLDNFPTFKKIHCEAIFGIICRALGITCKTLAIKISVSSLSLMAQLCNIHISVIKLMNSLILCARTNLLPFSSLIAKLFIQIFSLTGTNDWHYSKEKPYSSVRCAGYKCLLSWLSICKSASLTDAQINLFVEAILIDIKCNKKLVNINLDDKSKTTSKDNVISSEKMILSDDTCHSALSCITPLLGCPISFQDVKKLQETIINLLFEIQRSCHDNDSFPSPYSKSNCRAQLYSALLALCTSPHPEIPPPLHYANVLFHNASYDHDIEVSKICSHSIVTITHMLRPSAASFDLTADIDSEVLLNIKPSQSNKQSIKAISKRARQALYSTKSVRRDKGSSSHSWHGINDSSLGSEDCSNVVPGNQSADIENGKNQDDDLIDLAESSDESIMIIEKDDENVETNNSGFNLSCDQIEIPNSKPFKQSDRNKGSKIFIKNRKDEEKQSHLEHYSEKQSYKLLETVCIESGEVKKMNDEVTPIEVEEEPSGTCRSIEGSEQFEDLDHSINNGEKSKYDENTKPSDGTRTKSVFISSVKERLPGSTPKKEIIGHHNKGLEHFFPSGNETAEEITDIESIVASPGKGMKKTVNTSDTINCEVTENLALKDPEILVVNESSNSTFPSRKSKRNLRSNLSENKDKTDNKSKANLNVECASVQDEERPPTKKSKLLNNNSNISDNDNSAENVLKCNSALLEVEEDEDKDMLESFVDSVPE